MSSKDKKAYTALDQSSMPNFNSSWVNYKGKVIKLGCYEGPSRGSVLISCNQIGAWITAVFVIVALKALFTVIPFITSEASWTLTNLSYNCVCCYLAD
jgi:hypothetical protein